MSASSIAEAEKGGSEGPPNRRPKIEGTPGTTVRVSVLYEFVATVSDPDRGSLSFSIKNKPAWTSFDPSNGRIHGTPQATDCGYYPGILIIVSDGLE